MKHKWTKAELAYFNKPIPKAEQNDDAIIWFVLNLVSLCGIWHWIYTVLKGA